MYVLTCQSFYTSLKEFAREVRKYNQQAKTVVAFFESDELGMKLKKCFKQHQEIVRERKFCTLMHLLN